LVIIISILALSYSTAQSIIGLSGLVSIPTAEINGDGRLTIGASFLHKGYIQLYSENYHGLATYINFSFLPNIEFGLRLTRLINYPNPQALGDRMPTIRIRIFEEGKIIPSVLFGAHDFLRTSESKSSYSTATYLVMTKNIELATLDYLLKLNIGHGLKLLKSSGYQFEKLFYGVSLRMLNHFELLIENDSKTTNGGLRFSIFNLSATFGLMSFENIVGTFNYSIQL